MRENSFNHKTGQDLETQKEAPLLTRKEYQEILLARMAGGDLFANEDRMKIREIDILLDSCRDTPIYPKNRIHEH